MGISVGFIVKHVRPFGAEGFEAFCSDALISVLSDNLNFTWGDILNILVEWRDTALSDPVGQSNVFVDAAKQVAMARWQELYTTPTSTLMFLDEDQLASLSLAAQNAGPDAQVDWLYGDDLAICVSITFQTGAHHIRWNARGCRFRTDDNANANHFIQLL